MFNDVNLALRSGIAATTALRDFLFSVCVGVYADKVFINVIIRSVCQRVVRSSGVNKTCAFSAVLAFFTIVPALTSAATADKRYSHKRHAIRDSPCAV